MTPDAPADPLPSVPSAALTRHDVGDVELHAIAAGPESGPLVVALHGFPEFWYGWRRLVDPLVDAGYRVLVPDQRGYNRSEKPKGVRPYRLRAVVGDVAGLIAAEGRDSARVVGHDWGGAVAWHLALARPDLVDRLGIVNAPHPTAFRRTLRTDPRQWLRSRYVLYVQPPRLPEWLSTRGGFRLWVRALERARPGTFSRGEIRRYRRAWSRPGAPTAMLNWYRALLRCYEPPPRDRVRAPTLVCWGEDDDALVPDLARRSVAYCEGGRLARFPDATHWVHHERPDRIATLLLDHLG